MDAKERLHKMNILLVGAGNMAIEYAKVLNAHNVDFTVIGRGNKSADTFEKTTNIKILKGGIDKVFDQLSVQPTHAIIASTLESLEENTLYLLHKGISNILIEKPASLSSVGMKKIYDVASKYNANVFIAYNRRFFASVIEAQYLIEKDGGLSSFLFEFTEWSHIVGSLKKTPIQLDNWFIGNSTHVVDMAFFFGGKPKEMTSYVASNLEWHPKGSIYAGSGITERDILFSYHANWEAPGSWKLELLTSKNRYIFRPLEKLKVQRIGSVDIEEINIDDKLDFKYKAGLYEQTNAFLNETLLAKNLLTIEDALELIIVYEKMNGVVK